MTPRDKQILLHIARHRLSIRPVLAKLFFKSQEALGNVLARLMNSAKDESRSAFLEPAKLPDGYSYYQLTDAGAQAVGQRDAPRVQDEHTLHAALSALWFCQMGDRTRLLLTAVEEEELLGAAVPGALHCIEPAEEWSVLHELYVPASSTREENVLDRLQKRLEQRRKDQNTRDWVASRNLTFAIMVENTARRESLKQRIAKAELRRFTKVFVELAPGPTTLRAFLDGHNGHNQ